MKQKINTTVQLVKKLCKIFPVTEIIVATAQFDIQKIKNPTISGKQYQEGEQLGYANVKEYVHCRDGHKCQHCKGKSGDKVLHVHHIESRKTGGNAPNNLILLCETCHKAHHDGKIELKESRKKSMKAEALMSVMRPAILKWFQEVYPDIPVKKTF
ncbi:hypothetical protein FACS189427_13490 [Planctomycetales bacterium]|nr:hypothetical protein FACS189427_13490 [Planctomycetales bacterium]